MRRLFTLMFAFGLTLAACQSKPNETAEQRIGVSGGTYTNVSADELNVMLKNKNFVFINVHIPFAGNITGTDLSIPYDI